MKLETKLLRPAVSAATKLSSRRATLPILNHLLLTPLDDGLCVSATDIDIWTESNVASVSGKLTDCCVPARSFNSLIETAGEFVTLESDKTVLIVSSDGWKRRMSTLPADEFPKRPDTTGMKKQGFEAGILANAVEAVTWAGDEHAGRRAAFWQESVLVEMAPKSLKASGMRGTIFAQSSEATICSTLTWQLPIKSADLFTTALRGEGVELLHSDKRIAVVHAGGFFSAALPEQKWSNYAALIKSKRVSLGATELPALMACLERARTVYTSTPDYVPITIEVEGGTWKIATEPGTDHYDEEIEPTKSNTAKRSLRVNSVLLLESLKHFPNDAVVEFGMDPDMSTGGLFLEHEGLLVVVARLIFAPKK